MRRLLLAIVVLVVVSCSENKKSLKPPVPEKIPVEVGMHGDSRIDNYYWMNEYFKKGAGKDKVIKYLQEENKYTESVLSDIKNLRDTLFNEMKARIKETDQSVPIFENGYYYYNRYEKGKQYAIYCRKKGSLDAPGHILLNINELAKGHPYFEANGFTVSPDNKLLAFGVDTLARRQYTIYIKNLETGEIYSDAMYPASPDIEWANDSKTLFYVEKNRETLLTEKVRKHVAGTSAVEDKTVYTEKDKSNYLYLDKSRSNKFLLISSSATMSTEVLYLDADQPENEFKTIQPRMKEVKYAVDEQNGKFLLLTNLEAKNFRLMETPVDKTGVSNWKEVIPHRKDVLLEDVNAFRDYYVLTERKNGLTDIKVYNNKTNEDHYLQFGEPAYMSVIGSNPEFNTSLLRFEYTSLTTPYSVFDYDMKSRTKKLLKEQEVAGGYNKEEYETERLPATAADGVKVPVSIVYRKDFRKDGNSPLLLYGYGSYGYS